jgi:hypothetical protein
MMNLQNLSKQKHIYQIYESSDGHIHCEKYQIIYLNSKVVYFKGARKQELLNYVRIEAIETNFATFAEEYLHTNRRWRFNKYFWDIEENIQELYKEFKERRKLNIARNDRDKLVANLANAKREYEKCLLALEMSNKQLEE